MQHRNMFKVLLWTWIILDSGVCSVSLPDITDGKFIDECVRQHNAARSSVSPAASNMLYMTWDEGLAITARAWARRCVFEHNTYRPLHPTFLSVGENLWVGSPGSFDVTRAIKKWVDEKQDFNYNSNDNSKAGHYTQVVWAPSYKVGCAAQLCPDGATSSATKEAVIFVCNYAPAGNVFETKPFESQGASCSGCQGTCEKNLCRSEARDSLIRYNWTPDWDVAPSTSDTYVPILVVRPAALILTFLAAYAVRHFYPDVFCYD